MADVDFKSSNLPEIARYEHRRKNVGAKAVVLYGYDSATDTYLPITAIDNGDGTYSMSTSGSGGGGGTSTAVIDPRSGFGISDKESTSTYKYFGFEDAAGKWYILRKTIATNAFLYAYGTSGYATAWTNRASQTYDTFDNTFSPVTGSVITAAVQINTYQSNPTATLSNVSGSATSVTLLASNTSRKGVTIYNDSSAILYVKFGASASTTSFTIKMAADTYYEVPFGYTGIIAGIWASATGSARVTEMT